MRIQDLSLSRKVFFCVLLLIFPVLLLGYFLVVEKSGLVTFTQHEIAGVHYLSALQKGLAVSTAPVFDKAAAQSAAAAIQKAEVEDNGVTNLTAKAHDVVVALGGDNAADAVSKISAAISAASDNSNITLDPDADAYFVGDMLVNQGQGILQRTADIYAAAGALLKERTEDNVTAFAVARDALSTYSGNYASDLTKAIKGNADGVLNANIGTPGKAVTELADKMSAAATANNYALVSDLAPKLSAAVGASFPILDQEMERLLVARIAGFHHEELMHLGICFVFAFIGIVLTFLVVRSVTDPLNTVIVAMEGICAGKLDVDIGRTDRHDEVGRLIEVTASSRCCGKSRKNPTA